MNIRFTIPLSISTPFLIAVILSSPLDTKMHSKGVCPLRRCTFNIGSLTSHIWLQMLQICNSALQDLQDAPLAALLAWEGHANRIAIGPCDAEGVAPLNGKGYNFPTSIDFAKTYVDSQDPLSVHWSITTVRKLPEATLLHHLGIPPCLHLQGFSTKDGTASWVLATPLLVTSSLY